MLLQHCDGLVAAMHLVPMSALRTYACCPLASNTASPHISRRPHATKHRLTQSLCGCGRSLIGQHNSRYAQGATIAPFHISHCCSTTGLCCFHCCKCRTTSLFSECQCTCQYCVTARRCWCHTCVSHLVHICKVHAAGYQPSIIQGPAGSSTCALLCVMPDPPGSTLVTLTGRSSKLPRWILTA